MKITQGLKITHFFLIKLLHFNKFFIPLRQSDREKLISESSVHENDVIVKMKELFLFICSDKTKCFTVSR